MEFLKDKKILIIDDEPTIRMTHKLLIEKLGAINICEATNVDDALNLILKDNDFDLIISDYIMPEKTGLDLYKILILNNIQTPFAMVTANSDIDAVKEMIELGINAILVKPITKEMLISRVSKILR